MQAVIVNIYYCDRKFYIYLTPWQRLDAFMRVRQEEIKKKSFSLVAY